MNARIAHKPAGAPRRLTVALRLLSGLCLAGAVSHAQFQMPPAESFDHGGWIAGQAQVVAVDGNAATFQQRHQMPQKVSGGLDSWFHESFPSRDVSVRAQGRGVPGLNQYDLTLAVAKKDLGFVRVGFKNSRHWSEGRGLYAPATGAWFTLPNADKLHLDRGLFFAEVGLDKPGTVKLNLKYSYDFRDGVKDSTVLGRSGLTGVGNRGIVPSTRDIDEKRHTVHATLEHEVGNTTLGGGLRYQFYKQNNTLNLRQFPVQGATEQHIAHREGVSSDLFSTNAWTSSQLSEHVRLNTGYLYTKVDNDITGDRLTFNPGTGARGANFRDMNGWTQLRQHVANINLFITKWENVLLVPSLSFERQETEAYNAYSTNAVQTVASESEAVNHSQRIELRYVGKPGWRFYARADWKNGDHDLTENMTTRDNRITESERSEQRYTLGANWNPNAVATASANYYYAIRKNDYDHLLPSRIGRHPAFIQQLDYETHAFNARLTLRPAAGVTVINRYDYQVNLVDMQGSLAQGTVQVPLAMLRSGDLSRHMFSQALTWMPKQRVHVQAGWNYATSTVDTPANRITGEAWSGQVVKSRYDYLYTHVNVTYVYTETTDFTVGYSYYGTDNAEDNWALSTAYGYKEHEHGVRLGMTYRASDNQVWRAGYALLTFRDDLSAGNRDYDAHLFYAGLTLRY